MVEFIRICISICSTINCGCFYCRTLFIQR